MQIDVLVWHYFDSSCFHAVLKDSAILSAIENENACNPVLRTSAEATIAIVDRYE